MNKAQRRRHGKECRRRVYNKCDGHCAYCGQPITYKNMQIDHVIPLNGYSVQGADTEKNMLPSCRSCNSYKRASTLEGFRKQILSIPHVLSRDSVTYRIGERYGIITQISKKVEFYFEHLGIDAGERRDRDET